MNTNQLAERLTLLHGLFSSTRRVHVKPAGFAVRLMKPDFLLSTRGRRQHQLTLNQVEVLAFPNVLRQTLNPNTFLGEQPYLLYVGEC